MNANERSKVITHGVERTPNRAMLRAVGFSDSDFEKPIIGVANGYSTITPCNASLNDLALRAVDVLQPFAAIAGPDSRKQALKDFAQIADERNVHVDLSLIHIFPASCNTSTARNARSFKLALHGVIVL